MQNHVSLPQLSVALSHRSLTLICRLLFGLTPLWLLFATGCATSGRYILLEEYEAITPAQSQDLSLKDIKLLIGSITYVYREANEDYFDGTKGEKENNVGPLTASTYVELSKANAEKWSAKQQQIVKGYKQNADDIIGGVRNGFGTTMSSIYALNSPGEWLTTTITNEAKLQGAIIVDKPEEADIRLDGQIIWLYADTRVGVWSIDCKTQFVTNLKIHLQSGETLDRTISTDGGAQITWTTDYEYYRAIRDAHHKFIIKLFTELRKIKAATSS